MYILQKYMYSFRFCVAILNASLHTMAVFALTFVCYIPQGASIDVYVWDEDTDNIVRPREFVDRFHYDYSSGVPTCRQLPVSQTGLEAPKSGYTITTGSCIYG